MTPEGQILMEKGDARLFQQEAKTHQHNWNIVELEVLESRRQLRLKVNDLIRLASNSTLTTREIQQHLLLGVATFGNQLAVQLVRSLQRDDAHERETVTPLQHMSRNKRLPRSIRLSAALALAGMGATAETREENRRIRLYAIS